MERTIQRIQPTKLAERKILRVAAYTRVSCDKDAMKQSLAAQISYYSGITSSTMAGCSLACMQMRPTRVRGIIDRSLYG